MRSNFFKEGWDAQEGMIGNCLNNVLI